jgi:hypothetical protein
VSVTLTQAVAEDLLAKHASELAASGLSPEEQGFVDQATRAALFAFSQALSAVKQVSGHTGVRLMERHFVEVVTISMRCECAACGGRMAS